MTLSLGWGRGFLEGFLEEEVWQLGLEGGELGRGQITCTATHGGSQILTPSDPVLAQPCLEVSSKHSLGLWAVGGERCLLCSWQLHPKFSLLKNKKTKQPPTINLSVWPATRAESLATLGTSLEVKV